LRPQNSEDGIGEEAAALEGRQTHEPSAGRFNDALGAVDSLSDGSRAHGFPSK
jgi:hypothetical protein